MIDWAWTDQLATEELAAVTELARVAAEYDAEAGFSTVVPEAPASGELRHLLVTMPPPGSRESPELDALPDVPVVAYLRLDVEGDTCNVQLVVHPAFRSLGVTTLLVEQLDAADAWKVVPGVRWLRAWAHGAHPAAERAGRRFGGDLEHAVFKTLRVLGGNRPFHATALAARTEPIPGPVPELVPGHHLTLSPADREVLGRADTVLRIEGLEGRALLGVDVDEADAHRPAVLQVEVGEPDHATIEALLTQGLLRLQDEGARVVHCHVDALDEATVTVSRSLGLVHDQSDFLYRRALPL